jgi:LCP family protein required for cell wall assembly
MMVVHLVPAQGSAFVVSFPRDTEVDIPDHGSDKLNAAYAYGGPALLLRTFQEEFGIKIQHYLAVDFQGFQDIANAIGRVKIYFPTAARDFDTGLYQGAGCQALQGDQALAYARSRHYEIPADGVQHPDPQNPDDWVADPLQDLDRIKRQQYFLRSLGQTALDRGASNFVTANRLADAVVGNLSADESLSNKEIKSLVRTFRGLDPATVEMTTLPVAQESNGGPLLPQYPEAKPVLDRLKDLSQPVLIPQLSDPSDVRVVVVDGSGTEGRATGLQRELVERGFVDGGVGDASKSDYEKTQVRYAGGHAVDGLTVGLYVGTTDVVEAASTTLQLGSQKLTGDVIVIVGKDFPKLRGLLARASSSTSTSHVSRSSTTSSTTTTTIQVPDTRYVPVSPNGLKPLVGCP